MATNIRIAAINRLLARKKALQEQYDRMVAEPAAYGITGSVNATNRRLDELRSEIVSIDSRLEALIQRTKIAGMTVKWPDYRHWPIGGDI